MTAANYPAPSMDAATQKYWAVLLQSAATFVGVLAPIIAYAFLKDRGVFIKHNIVQVLNFQITAAIVLGAAGALLLIPTSIAIGPVPVAQIDSLIVSLIGIVIAVFQIIAIIQTSRGKFYVFPLAFPFFN